MSENQKLYLLCISLLLIIITGVKLFLSSKIKLSISENQELIKRKDIYIEIIDSDVTPTSLSYRVFNNKDEDIYYGKDFAIEIYKNNKWREFNIEVSWIAIAVLCESKNNTIEKVDFSNTYGKLKNGRYRLIKTINNTIVFDEFEIKWVNI